MVVHPNPRYLLTLWRESAPGQWESRLVTIEDAADVDQVLAFAAADDWATVFELHVHVDGGEMLRLHGVDPVDGAELRFRSH
jgi:hypothetical protein